MGGAIVTHGIEEGISSKVGRQIMGTLFRGGERMLEKLGPEGEALLNKFETFEAIRDGNKSSARSAMESSFSKIPEQYHQDVENFALGKPHSIPPQHMRAAREVKLLKDGLEQHAHLSGQRVYTHGQHSPFMVSMNGPYVHNPQMFKPNNILRKQAVSEIMMKYKTDEKGALSILNEALGAENGDNAASHISYPRIPVESGRLPIAQRWSKWAAETAEKTAKNTFFGPKYENIVGAINNMLKSKKYGPIAANTVADFADIYFKETHPVWRDHTMSAPVQGIGKMEPTGLRRKSAYQPEVALEKSLKKVSSWFLTGKIGLYHTTQIINSIYNEGLINTMSGLSKRITSYPAYRDLVIQSGVLEEQLERSFYNQINPSGKVRGIFDTLFHQPGFQQVRKFQIEVAALSGQREAEMAAEQVVKGGNDTAFTRLMSGGTKGAEATLKRLGIDPAEVRRLGGLDDEMSKRAMYSAGKHAMFFRTPLQRPVFQEAETWRRMMFLYSHYHFNMFTMIKDGFESAAKEHGINGVVAQALKLGTIFPIAGVLVQAFKNAVIHPERSLEHPSTLLKPDFTVFGDDTWAEREKAAEVGDLTRSESPTNAQGLTNLYINGLAHASAFGIAYSIGRITKAEIQREVLANITSPVINWAAAHLENIYKAAKSYSTLGDANPAIHELFSLIPVYGSGIADHWPKYSPRHHGLSRPSRSPRRY